MDHVTHSGEPQRVGPYRLVRELGRGGQAIVWLAEDTRIDRQVALKLLPFAGPGAAEALRRFRREAEVASRLAHPGICPVFDADLDAGTPYIAMRHVPGETLAKQLELAREARRPLPEREALRAIAATFEKVARALHAAHEAGIVHRDVKPANVMITPEGEPVVLDFGLAREDDGTALGLSASGEVSGTPAYMSPEQLVGKHRPDRRTDVWGLGIALHEALTLAHPFAAVTREGLFHSILSENPSDARRANRAIDRDLATILATATAKERDRRYQTALDLAEDLRRWQANEPIRARPVGRLERMVLWVQRKPALAASMLASALFLVAAGGFLAYGLVASNRARTETALRSVAEAERKRADEARAALEQVDRDAKLFAELDLVNLELGTLFFGFDAETTMPSLLPRFVAAFREWGADLERPGAADAVWNALGELRARSPKMDATVLQALRNIGWIILREGAAPPPVLEQNVRALLARIPDVAWPELDEAKVRWRRDQVDTFDALLRDEVLDAKTSEQIDELASALITIPPRLRDAERVLERALRSDPGSFRLHFLAAALGFMQASGRTELGIEEIEAARRRLLHHTHVAVALRPESAFVRVMLAMALAINGQYVEADQAIHVATDLEPTNALVWFFTARFYAYWPDPTPGIAACRRALELDPGLGGVMELQAQLEARVRRR